MVGQTLGHYRVLEKIGEGGMGVVFRAHDEHLDRDVALKVLPAGTLGDEAARRRFRKEALALSKLNHPHIETVHDFDTQEGTDFLVMEYVPGTTLSQMLASGALPEKEIARLGTQLAEGLAAAHDQGVVHRDLKPGNLRVTPDGRLKILDFGLAKLLQPASEPDVTRSVSETHAVAGTLPYMAPEQLRDELTDSRTDIYAAGVVLFEMATGQRPFQGRLTSALTDAILHHPCPQPTRLMPALSPRLEEIILKCLDKDPERRYQSSRELRVDLERLTSSAADERGARGRPQRRASVKQIKSLAVLPLANLSRDPEQDYFADGMTEALISDLAKIGALKVISRTSVMRYKGTKKSLPEIAGELNVDAVMEGSVLRVGDRVRITAQLIHAATDTHLWGDSYDRDLRDVLALQSEAARAIASEIQVKLKPQERARLARKARRVDPEAHEALLRARYHWSKWSPEGFRKGIEYFQKAIERDPSYAPAYAGLADSFAFAGYWGYLPSQEVYPKAKAAAVKALEMDETLGDAHKALSMVHWFYDWDLPGCRKEIERALELGPNDAISHLWHAVYLGVIHGDHETAVREARKAQELDPLSVFVGTMVSRILWWARRDDQAIEQCRKTLEMDPNFLQAHFVLGNAYLTKSMHQEAIATFQKAVELEGSPHALSYLGRAYALAGEPAKARAILAELEQKAKAGYVHHFALIWLYAALGENDKAFEWLERAFQEKVSMLFWLKAAPVFDPLRADARFEEVLRRMNFPP